MHVSRRPDASVPRVSVVVPAFNAAGHVAVALASVAAQTYADWEIVVADDGSTDATGAVAASHPGVRVVRSHVNRGLAATRNLALAHARGELVALLDSDDAWKPNYLAEQVALFDAEQANSGRVGIVCCDADLVGPNGALGITYAERFGAPSQEMAAADLLVSNCIFVSALLPRSVIQEAGGFDERLRSVEDLDLWLRVVELGYRVVYNPKPLASYRLAPGTLSRDTLRMTRSRQVVYRKALARGRLTPGERRIVERELRLQRAAEIVELLRRNVMKRPIHAAVAAIVAAPFGARVAIERSFSRRGAR